MYMIYICVCVCVCVCVKRIWHYNHKVRYAIKHNQTTLSRFVHYLSIYLSIYLLKSGELLKC